jgi:hypothetical protein
MPQTENETVNEFVDRILAGGSTPPPQRHVYAQMDIQVIKQFRVLCPQCGELPDSPYGGLSDATTARRNHWTDHRDERV